jgi:DNA-binding CsgD family transcriptional regulator
MRRLSSMVSTTSDTVYSRKVVLQRHWPRVYILRMSARSMQRASNDIARLSGQGLDLVTFWKESSAILARAVPLYQSPCWFTLDPASLLATSHFQTELPELPGEWLAHEYFEDDFHKIADVARSPRGVSTIHDATGGDPARSPGWSRYIQPFGADQELLLAMRTRTGNVWGVVGIYREPDRPLFTAEEVQFLQDVSVHLAEGTRRGLLVGEATDPEGPDAPGLVVLREDWSVESLTPGTEVWLDELPDSNWTSGAQLPPSVLAVAGRALRTSEHPDAAGEVAFARVLSRSGRWIVLHGASLTGGGARKVAVIIEPAHPARISSLLMAAYGLTDREQELTRLVLQGYSTAEIAVRLNVTTHTVQQHLKSIFDKTSVRSRRELTGTVFFSHYEPRLRENEQRVLNARPVRGEPVGGSTHSV